MQPSSTRNDASLVGGIWSPSGYDDQGLFFTLIFGGALVIFFTLLFSVVLSTPVLWVKRLYRTNHTVKPVSCSFYEGSGGKQDRAAEAGEREELPFSSSSRPTSPVGDYLPSFTDNSSPGKVPCVPTSGSLDESRRETSINNFSLRSPTVKVSVTAYPGAARRHPGKRVTRCKRLGVSLPFRSAFFRLPTFKDWINVEETSLPYLAPILPELVSMNEDNDGEGDCEAGNRKNQNERRTTEASTKAASCISRSSAHGYDEESGMRSPPVLRDTEGNSNARVDLCSPTERPWRRTSLDYATIGEMEDPLDPTNAHLRSYGTSEEEEEEEGIRMDNEEEPVSPPTSAWNDQRENSTFRTTNNRSMYPSISSLPRTPLDPQVSMYLFSLKYFTTFLVAGLMFVIWVTLISSSENYIGAYMIQRDTRVCRRQSSAHRCLSLAPYCTFDEVEDKCVPVAVRGIYQLTAQNIPPGSPSWLSVGLLNMGFCLVFVLTTIYYISVADNFIEIVMRAQMKRAMGYRVACVRGLDSGFFSEEGFRKRYLDESAYFGPLRSSRSDSPLFNDTDRNNRQTSNNDDAPTTISSSDVRNVARAVTEEELTNIECLSIRCLYSTLHFTRYRTRREDALFTRPGRVKQISHTRAPPPGMYKAIRKAETDKAALQEAVAHEKALQRQTLAAATIQQPSSIETDNHISVSVLEEHVRGDETEPQHLMMRKPFPSCCQKIPAVPYREQRFRESAKALNDVIDKVPRQRTAGSVFVVFSDALSAFEFVNLFNTCYARSFRSTSAVIAGPSSGVIFSNLPVGRLALYLRVLFLSFLYVILLFFWSVPVSFLSSLDNIEALPVIGPSVYTAYVTYLPPSLQNIVTAYLPVGVLALFNVVLPYIIRWMVGAMGVFNKTEQNGGHLYFQYIFMVLTAVVFQAALQGGIAQLGEMVGNGIHLDVAQRFFVSCVTPIGGYWYAKIIMATGLSAWLELIDIGALLKLILGRGSAHVQRRYDALFQPCDFEYPKIYSFDLMILSIGLLFHMTAPLLTLFTTLYFIVRYFTMRQRLYERYRPKRMPVEDCTDFGVSVQVFRNVVSLYIFAEFCGFWIMHYRQHVLGQILSVISLSIGVMLWIWVWRKTSAWTPSLAKARSNFQHRHRSVSDPLRDSVRHSNESPNNATRCAHEQEPLGVETEEKKEDVFTVVQESQIQRDNPFAGNLLPQHKSVVARYHPKHQRLAQVNVDEEVQRMKATEFVVERYWDSAISWFETDHMDDGELSRDAIVIPTEDH